MVILSFISSGLEFRSVNLNHTSINENSKLKLKKIYIYIYCEISSNWTNDLLGTNVYKTVESCW